ncbi:hypothetical protein [Parafilimonas terrae]|uniref:Uncharacterized protein n=1 Tax=Parafilimonas terrae TaxID=1465490 RepID=A0A1I5V577_9BACT|nr:hypothetical protein [Parafilimonas terrae]SFQ02532.1 hypothetical protein SAMN05444277_104212 [Parafilimonas terrae]
MQKKPYTTLFFESILQKEQYHALLSWQQKTKGCLLLAKLTAPADAVPYCIFKYSASGNFSILANSLAVHTSYNHCFIYRRNMAWLSYRKTENKLYYKGNAEARSNMLRFLTAGKLRAKLGLDFLTETDVSFAGQSTALLHKLFAKEITAQSTAWKFYLQHCYHVEGNIDYKSAYRLYGIVMKLTSQQERRNYTELFFKILCTSNNLQRDIRHFCSDKKLRRTLVQMEEFINNSFLMHRKVNYTLSQSRLEETYALQMQDLLHIKIKNGLEQPGPLIPFLPATMEFTFGGLAFYLLNDAAVFHEEGLAMRNCIFECSAFRKNTMKGEALYFSVRSTQHTHLRGTLEIYINEHAPLLHQFKSRLNEYDFLHPGKKSLPFGEAFLHTTRSFIESSEMRSFFYSIYKHFKSEEEQL